MAEQTTKSKYGALAEVKQKPAMDDPGETTPQAEPLSLAKATKPQGKRSDPQWKQYSILLKMESHKQAGIILRQKYEGVDISDLMQALLEKWVASE